MRILLHITGIGLVLLLLAESLAGTEVGGGILHPRRRPLTPALVAEADAAFARVHATREDFQVSAADGERQRGWKVRAGHLRGRAARHTVLRRAARSEAGSPPLTRARDTS